MGLLKYAMDGEFRSPLEVRNEFYYDETDDRIILNKTQDVEPILQSNREKQNIDDGYTKDRSMRRVARIPLVIIEKIKREQGWDPMDQNNLPRLMQLLDDPDYAYLKTSHGKVAKTTRREYHRASTASLKPVFHGEDK